MCLARGMRQLTPRDIPLFFQQLQESKNQAKGCKRNTVNKPTSAPPKGMAPLPPKMTGVAMPSQNNSTTNTIDQKNRSLTVMIPRAKYQSQHGNFMLIDASQPIQQHQMHKSDVHHHQPNCGVESIGSTAEAKLLTYLDANPSTSKVIKRKNPISPTLSFTQFALFASRITGID